MMKMLNYLKKTMFASLVSGISFCAALAVTPAEASKLVALVIGTSSPGADVKPRIKDLEENLFAYGGSKIEDARIFAGHNLTRNDLLAHLSAFERSSDGEEVVTVVAYIGPVAHSEKGNTYIVPADWNGEDERGLVALHNTLELLKSKGRNYVMLDATPVGSNLVWKATAVKPGLGKLGSYGMSDRLAIAYAEVPISALERSPISVAFSKKLSLERIKFGELPELVYEEAMFDSGRTTLPRKVGALGGSTELVRLKNEEFEQRKRQCRTARAEASNKAEAVIVHAAPVDNRIVQASSGNAQIARRDFIEWFCPELSAPPPPPKRTAPMPAPQPPKIAGRTYDAGTPVQNKGNSPSYARTGGNSNANGGSKGSGWAGSAVPLPN